MLLYSIVLTAALSVSTEKIPVKEVHYYPEKEKPLIHAKTTATKVCALGKKAPLNGEQVCLSCEEKTTYIDPWCYRCPEGTRIASIQRKAVKQSEQVRCISKGPLEDQGSWKEMPPLKIEDPVVKKDMGKGKLPPKPVKKQNKS